MTYADISIVPVASERKAVYLEFSERMAEVYRDHGASSVVTYWQSSGSVDQADFHADGTPYGPDELRGIAELAGANPSESVSVTVTTWPSREARDRGTAAATKDPRVLETMDEEPVFDGSRVVGESFDLAMDVHVDE